MDRRLFLRNAALLVAGAVAVDQLELVERLAPRRLFAAWPVAPTLWGDGIHDDTLALQWRIDEAVRAGGVVRLPAGHFRLSAPLTVSLRNGMTLDGASAMLSSSASPALHIPTPHLRGATIRNMYLTSTRSPWPSMGAAIHVGA